MVATDGVLFVAAALRDGDVRRWLSFVDVRRMMESQGEEDLYDWVDGYARKHGELPTLGMASEALEEKIKAPEGALGHHYEKLRDRYLTRGMFAAVDDAKKYLAGSSKNPSKALEALEQHLIDLRVSTSGHSVSDLRSGLEDAYEEYKARMTSPATAGLFLGWPTVDKMSGGFLGGEVISMVGRPAAGKTFKMLWIALQAWGGAVSWDKTAAPVPLMFATQEMSAGLIYQRLAAMVAGIPMDPIKIGIKMPKEDKKRLEQAIKEVKAAKVPFYVVDGRMASTVADIARLARALHVSAIYVDGAYLLKHPDRRLGRYDRVAENMDLLKETATLLDVPVICSWQFSREAARKIKKMQGGKKGEKVDLEDIGYSDAIGQHSTLVLGFLQAEGISTIHEREVSIMKGRHGETGMFKVYWDFMNMRFGEIEEEAVAKGDLDYT